MLLQSQSANLAMLELRGLKDNIDSSLGKCGDKMDAYTKAHLVESQTRIDRALNAEYVYNGSNNQQSGRSFILLGEEAPANRIGSEFPI